MLLHTGDPVAFLPAVQNPKIFILQWHTAEMGRIPHCTSLTEGKLIGYLMLVQRVI